MKLWRSDSITVEWQMRLMAGIECYLSLSTIITSLESCMGTKIRLYPHPSRRVHTHPNPSHKFFRNCWHKCQSTYNEYVSLVIHEHRSRLLFHTVIGMGFEGSWWRILLQLETRRQQHCNEICLHFYIRPRCSLATFVSLPRDSRRIRQGPIYPHPPIPCPWKWIATRDRARVNLCIMFDGSS